jgi:hypothetical protein
MSLEEGSKSLLNKKATLCGVAFFVSGFNYGKLYFPYTLQLIAVLCREIKG